MKGTIHSFYGILIITALLVSCSKDSDSGNCSESEETSRHSALTHAQELLLDAQVLNQGMPSPENCLAYREAYVDYLEALAHWMQCLEGPAITSWNEIYAMQEQELNNIQC